MESACLKWYFKVYRIRRSYRDGKDIGYILLLKKAVTPTMKLSFSTEKCHVAWCENLSEDRAKEIERSLEEDPAKKKKFDELPPLFPCLQNLYFLDIGKEQTESLKEKLKSLPRYFTEERFDNFIRQEGLRKYVKASSPDPKNDVTLTIYTQEWLVDPNKNMLFCDPRIGNMWGKLAKLDDEKWGEI